jgi:hypothetical protein
MSMSTKKREITMREEDEHEDGSFFDQPENITVRTQAAMDMIRISESLGFYDRLVLVMSRRSDIFSGDAEGSPRPEERRKEQWRGKEKGFASEDRTSTEEGGESSSLDRMVQDKWSRVLQEMRRNEQRRKRGKKSRD